MSELAYPVPEAARAATRSNPVLLSSAGWGAGKIVNMVSQRGKMGIVFDIFCNCAAKQTENGMPSSYLPPCCSASAWLELLELSELSELSSFSLSRVASFPFDLLAGLTDRFFETGKVNTSTKSTRIRQTILLVTSHSKRWTLQYGRMHALFSLVSTTGH